MAFRLAGLRSRAACDASAAATVAARFNVDVFYILQPEGPGGFVLDASPHPAVRVVEVMEREVGPAGLEPATYGLKVRSSTD